jgi:hypothetical protein
VSLRHGVHAGASEDLTSLVSSADMPNPTQQTDDELLERAKRLAGQFSDPRIVTIVFADAIHRGIGRITEVIATRQ